MKVITDAGLRPRVNGLSLAIAELVRGSRTAAAGGALLASALATVPVDSSSRKKQQKAINLSKKSSSRARASCGKTSRRTAQSRPSMKRCSSRRAPSASRHPEPLTAVRARRHAVHDGRRAANGHQHGRCIDRQPARPWPEPEPRAHQRPARDAGRPEIGRRYELDSLGRDPTRRGDLGRRLGRVRRGRRRRRRQLHPQGQLRRRFRRRPLRRYARRRRSDDHRSRRSSAPTWPTTAATSCSASSATPARSNTHGNATGASRTSANPNTAGGGFAFGSATWFHNEPGGDTPNPNFKPTRRPARPIRESYRTTSSLTRRTSRAHRFGPGRIRPSSPTTRGRTLSTCSSRRTGCPFPNRPLLHRRLRRLDARSRTTWPPSRFRINQRRHRLHGFGRRYRPSLPARTNSTVRSTTIRRTREAATSTARSRAYRFS